jgi:hypothetical protein
METKKKASSVLTDGKTPASVADSASQKILGGLGGTLSTSELAKARAAYTDYAVKFDTEGGSGDRMTFDEFAKQWKDQSAE